MSAQQVICLFSLRSILPSLYSVFHRGWWPQSVFPRLICLSLPNRLSASLIWPIEFLEGVAISGSISVYVWFLWDSRCCRHPIQSSDLLDNRASLLLCPNLLLLFLHPWNVTSVITKLWLTISSFVIWGICFINFLMLLIMPANNEFSHFCSSKKIFLLSLGNVSMVF